MVAISPSIYQSTWNLYCQSRHCPYDPGGCRYILSKLTSTIWPLRVPVNMKPILSKNTSTKWPMRVPVNMKTMMSKVKLTIWPMRVPVNIKPMVSMINNMNIEGQYETYVVKDDIKHKQYGCQSAWNLYFQRWHQPWYHCGCQSTWNTFF